MISKVAKLLFFLFSVSLLFYVFLHNPEFPEPPPDAVQSMEPADTETSLRRAYFTNFTREEVKEHYRNQFGLPYGLDFLTYELNYPPEEAFTLIRDQTRSTHLAEFVHPLRESFFINEFVAQVPKDDIWYKGVHYEQKITVKLVRSSILVRVVVVTLTLFAIWILSREWNKAFFDFLSTFKNWKIWKKSYFG